MRYLSILFFLFLTKTTLSQVTVGVDFFDIFKAQDGKMTYYNDEGDTTIYFAFILRKSTPDPTPNLMVRVQLVLDNGMGIITPISDEFHIGNSSFSKYNQETELIEKTFTLKSNKKAGTIILQYSYILNFPGSFPAWTNNSIAFQTVKYVPKPTISGPDQFCDNGIYTLTHSTFVNLINAHNLATLTSLGNGQYKIQRISEANGTIILQAEGNGIVTSKSITVGSKPTSIIGNTSMNSGESYEFLLDGPASGVSWKISGDLAFVDYYGASASGNSFNIITSILPNNFPAKHVAITASFTNTCGMKQSITKELTINP